MEKKKLQQLFPDDSIAWDILLSQREIASAYGNSTNLCDDISLRDLFLSLLNEEHQIQAEMRDEMRKRGWISPQATQQQEIQQVKAQYLHQK